MHIAIITRQLPPERCGIADHSGHFARTIEQKGIKATLVGSRGGGNKNTIVIKDDWSKKGLSNLFYKLKSINIKYLVMQYTPLAFLVNRWMQNFDLTDFWKTCSKNWHTSLIVHETYFRTWQHPFSLFRGTMEKRLLQLLVKTSSNVFSASQPIVSEMKRWTLENKIYFLPIGSNVPLVAIDRNKFKVQHKIKPESTILTLFGGGTSLWWLKSYVNIVDHYLKRQGLKICWLFLGNAPKDWFRLSFPVISPGYLSPEELSRWLQLTDIFLVPHKFGLNAKRGTAIAALQHGLPIIGSRGCITDNFFKDIKGIRLFPVSKPKVMCEEVLKLTQDPHLRERLGKYNSIYYREHLEWGKIVETFLKTIFK